jgi:NitT/TauT family transport system substrate-binding protein
VLLAFTTLPLRRVYHWTVGMGNSNSSRNVDEGMRRSTLLLAGAALAATPSRTRAQGLTPIKVGTATGWTLAEGYLAQSTGFFKAAGLDAELHPASNGGMMTAALVGGAIDVAVTNVGSAADAFSHGLPIAIFAPSTLAIAGTPNTTLCVLKDSPIRGARDLIGKTVALATLHDLQQAALMNWLEKNDGDIKATNYTEITPSNMLVALKSGRVDAVVLSEFYSAVAHNDTRVLGRPYETLGSVIMTAAWIAKRSWLAENRATAQKFAAAIRTTAQWAGGHQTEMLALMQTVTGASHDTLQWLGRLALGERLDVAQIQPIINVSAKYGFLPRAFPATDMIAALS